MSEIGTGLQNATGIRQAIARGDMQSWQRAAHTLKGSVGSFSAADARAAALRLEQLDGQDAVMVETACCELEREIHRLMACLASRCLTAPAPIPGTP